MDKIKIVFLLTTLDIGGTERQFMEIVRRLDRKRFYFRVLAFSSDGKLREEIEALHISVVSLEYSGIKGKFRPSSSIQLYKLIRNIIQYFHREKPHIVQSFHFWGNIYGCLAAKIARVPVIITGRRSFLEERYIKRWHCRWLLHLSNFWTTAIVANSNSVRQYCLQQEKYITDKKIRVIYNGINLNRYFVNIDLAAKKRALQIPEDSQIIGIIANLRPCKGHQDFLKAAAVVLQTFPHTVFLLVGRDDGLQPVLEKLAKELRIHESFIFTGQRDDIPELLSILDVQVSTSLTESLSNAILEGMAAGKPVIATDVGGNSELVIHEKTGLLVPPCNPDRLAAAIIRLLGDRTLRDQLGNSGRARAEALFRVEHMISQTEAFYQQVVAESKRK